VGLEIHEVCDVVGREQVGKDRCGSPGVLESVMWVVVRNLMAFSDVSKPMSQTLFGVEATR
jgi:hypothetical protein